MSTWDRGILCSPTGDTGAKMLGICSPAILGTYQPLKEVEYLQPDMEAWIDSMVVDSPPLILPKAAPAGTAQRPRAVTGQSKDKVPPQQPCTLNTGATPQNRPAVTPQNRPALVRVAATPQNRPAKAMNGSGASFQSAQTANEIARAGQLVNQGPVCNAMTQGPNWLELAKQLCATQPMQGLTINVHYHGASPAASSGLYHAHGLGGADKQATQDVLPTCKDGGNLRDISNAQIRQPQEQREPRQAQFLKRPQPHPNSAAELVGKRQKVLAAGRKIIPPLPIGLPKPLCIPPLPIYSQPPAKEPGRKILGEKRPRPLAGKAKLLHEARLERERKEAETRMKKKPGPKPMISRSVFDDVSAAKRKVKKRSLKGLSACPCVDNPIAGFKNPPSSIGKPDISGVSKGQLAFSGAVKRSTVPQQSCKRLESATLGRKFCSRGTGRGRGRGRGRSAGATAGLGRGSFKSRAGIEANKHAQKVVQVSPIVAKSAGSRAKDDVDTETTLSEGSSCHPLMSNASADSPPPAKADSHILPPDRPPTEVVTYSGPPASPGNNDAEETALSNERTNGGLSSPSEDDEVLDYCPKEGTVTHSCLLILLEELANGNPEVTMMDLRKKLREYPGLDKYYLGHLEDSKFWFKSFRWIQGRKLIRCPTRGPLTAQMTEKGLELAMSCYTRACEAGYMEKVPAVDMYLQNKGTYTNATNSPNDEATPANQAQSTVP